MGNCVCEFGDIEHAESRSGFVAGNTLVEPVVASSNIDEGSSIAVTVDLFETIEHRIPKAEASVADRLRDQGTNAVELRRDEARAAKASEQTAVFGRKE